MSEVIWKYGLDISDAPTLLWIPSTATVVHVGEQAGKLVLWARLDPGHVVDTHRVFRVFGTGHWNIDESLEHVGTVQMSNGLVWHVMEDTG